MEPASQPESARRANKGELALSLVSVGLFTGVGGEATISIRLIVGAFL